MRPLPLFEIWIASLLIGWMFIAAEIGFRIGARLPSDEKANQDLLIGTVGGAALGLVALLLGFTFSSAGNRFFERYETMVAEANAIGTAYLRADLLKEPYRERYRETLRAYAESRIELFDAINDRRFSSLLERSQALHPVMWNAAMAGLRQSPEFHESLLPPLNDTIDLHATRLNRVQRHISPWVLGALILSSGVALMTLGFGCGLRRRRYWIFTASIGLLLAMVIWLVIDLDHPRYGLIQINQGPMIDLRRSLQRGSVP